MNNRQKTTKSGFGCLDLILFLWGFVMGTVFIVGLIVSPWYRPTTLNAYVFVASTILAAVWLVRRRDWLRISFEDSSPKVDLRFRITSPQIKKTFKILFFITLPWTALFAFGFSVAGDQRTNTVGYVLVAFVLGGLYYYIWGEKNQKAKAEARREAEQLRQVDKIRQQAEVVQAKPITAKVIVPIRVRIHAPLVEKLSPTQAVGLIRAILVKAQSGIIELALVGTREGIIWEFTHTPLTSTDELDLEELNELFASYYPGASVKQLPTPAITQQLYRTYHVYAFKAVRDFDRALSVRDIGRDDPLIHVAQALAELQDGETLKLSVTIHGVVELSEEDIMNALTISAYEAGYRYQGRHFSTHNWESAIGSAIGETIATAIQNQKLKGQLVQRYSDAETKHFLEKLSQPLVMCSIAVVIDSPTRERMKSLSRIHGAVQELSGTELKIEPGYTSQPLILTNASDAIAKTPTSYVQLLMTESIEPASPYLFMLTFDELAALWHLPHKGFPSALLENTAVHVPITRGFNMGENGVQIGINRTGQKTIEVFLPENDRTAHTAIIGKTGRGKSSLLHQMVHQDIAAGRGVCVIDPQGDLVSSILQHSIPPEREDDLLILDVGKLIDDVFYPPLFNLFVSGIEEDQRFQAAQRLVSIFTLSDNDFAERRMGNTLRQALMAVQELPNPTINDVYCLLFDEDYRNRLLPLVRNDIVANYWRKFDMKRENEQANIIQPLEWRIERFMLNSKLRTMSCNPARLNIGKLMAANKIILVSLGDESGSLPREELHLMAAALLIQIEYAARRKVITKSPFMVYLDEAQEFVDTNLPTMLSQLRGFGVGLVLANQYFDQLLGKTFKAVEGNISTLISFEVGKDDARTLLPYLEPSFTDNTLVSLGKYTAAVSMLDSQGRRGSAFSIETLPPPGHGKNGHDRETYLRRKVIEQWNFKSYDEVLTLIQERYANCGATAFEPRSKSSNKTDKATSEGYGEFFE